MPKDQIILLRADLNDSIENNTLKNTDRIDASLSSIFNILNKNNKIILISHLSENNQSLLPIANYIRKNFLNGEFVFLDTLDREEISNFVKINLHKNNNIKIIMLENLRSFAIGLEEKNDELFAKWLSSLADNYIFDAFSVAHREHATVISVPKYMPHKLGEIAQKEYNNLLELIQNKNKLLVLLGGAKISTKLPLINSLLESGSVVFVGGAMANTLLYLKGYDVKESLIEKDFIIKDNILNHQNLILLKDINNDYIWDKNKIVDINPLSIQKVFQNKNNILTKSVEEFDNIFWNGPFGLCEKGFFGGTDIIIETLNKIENKNRSIVGGGDTLNAIHNWEIRNNKSNKDKFSIKYISLSGGAALTFLEKENLIGIQANK